MSSYAAPRDQTKKTLVDVEQVKTAFQTLVEPGQVIELRVLDATTADSPNFPYTASGYFNGLEALIKSLKTIKRAKGVYMTLQPCLPDLLARASNRLRSAQDMRSDKATTTDAQILRYRWLPIDADPARASGISSTNQEHEAALAVVETIMRELRAEEWPEPIRGDSGNGWHLVYPIDLDNTPENTALIQRVLQGLAERFNVPDVSIDLTVFNPARIWKLYGTLACKGDDTPDRPHRLARLLETPARNGVVSIGQLQSVAIKTPTTTPTQKYTPRPGRGAQFSLDDFLAKHRIAARPAEDYKNGVKRLLERCPFCLEEDKNACAYELADGSFGFSCSHNRCANLHWHDFREHFEPGYDQAKSSQVTARKSPAKAELTTEEAEARGKQIEEVLQSNSPEQVLGAAALFAQLDATTLAQIKARIRTEYRGRISLADMERAIRAEQQKAGTEEESETAQARLTRICADAHYICTPAGDLYARVQVHNHYEVVSISERGSGFRRWLVYRFNKLYGQAPNSEALTQVMSAVQANATYEGEQAKVHTRIAEYQGCLYLDLADEKWRCIEISEKTWRIIECPPVYFRRPSGMLPLPEPRRNGKGLDDELRKFLNTKEDKDYILITAWLIGCLHPTGPYPVLDLNGERGSTKSKTTALLRNILDPNEAPARNVSKDERDAAITAQNNMIIALDNLSSIPLWLSDLLCRIATGSGYATREMYSDANEKVFSAKRPIVLNGIEDGIITQGDLLNRTILVTLAPPKEYIPEEDYDEMFKEAHPRILGALLNVAVIALRNRKKVQLKNTPRMADFARWVTAAEHGLNREPGTFLAIFAENQNNASSIITESSPVAKAIVQFMSGQMAWDGLTSELHDELKKYEVYSSAKTAPKTPNKLSGQLQRIAPAMRIQGIDIQQPKRDREGRKVIITRVSPPDLTPSSVDKTLVCVDKTVPCVDKNNLSTSDSTLTEEPVGAKNSKNDVGCVDKNRELSTIYPPIQVEREDNEVEIPENREILSTQPTQPTPQPENNHQVTPRRQKANVKKESRVV